MTTALDFDLRQVMSSLGLLAIVFSSRMFEVRSFRLESLSLASMTRSMGIVIDSGLFVIETPFPTELLKSKAESLLPWRETKLAEQIESAVVDSVRTLAPNT